MTNRIHVTLPPELHERLCNFVLKKYGVTEMHGKRNKIVIEAVQEYLDRHEKNLG